MEQWIQKNSNKLILAFGLYVLICFTVIAITTPKVLMGGCFERYQNMLSLAAEMKQDSSLCVERLDVYNKTTDNLRLRLGNIERFINQNY